jgi:hypothetical protein
MNEHECYREKYIPKVRVQKICVFNWKLKIMMIEEVEKEKEEKEIMMTKKEELGNR